MDINYKQVCEELFGTSDLDKLKAIADKLNVVNSRGAGRKPKFSKTEIEIMKQMKDQGMSMVDIAVEFHTTRQTVSRNIRRLAS